MQCEETLGLQTGQNSRTTGAEMVGMQRVLFRLFRLEFVGGSANERSDWTTGRT